MKLHLTFRASAHWALLLTILLAQSPMLLAQGTAFTYSGHLNFDGSPANGVYDLRFAIFNAAGGGGQQGEALTNSPTVVSNGLFTVTLDFGNQFPGADRWLEIGLRTNGGGGAFETLTPRQKFTAAPYAITAGGVSGTIAAAQLSGTVPAASLSGAYVNPVTFNNAANSFTGSGVGLTEVNAASLGGLGATNFWQLGGNTNTTAGTHFLGTTDEQPLELRVNNQRAFQILYGTNIGGYQSVNIIAGDTNNFLGTNVHGNFIAGGGSNWIGANSGYNVIGGGAGNTIPTNASFATIPGGVENSATEWSFAAGVRARANHLGSFVWNGTKAQILETTADHQFLIGALGGVGIGTNNPQTELHVRGTVLADAFVGDGSGLSNVTVTATITNPIPDFLLPASVARLHTNQTFTGSNAFTGVVIATNEANQFRGQFNGLVSGDGAGLTAVDAASLGGLGVTNFWQLGGNAGSTAGTHFLGTTDNQPLELRANDHRVLRLEPASAYYGAGSLEVGYDNAPNIVAGAAVNQVDPGVVGATIGGGGAESYWTSFTPGVPISNHISQYFGTIGGGGDNKIIGDNSTALDPFYKVGSTISGGWGNVSGGSFATVPGGKFNEARGNLSFAAGHRAKATNEGAFVWADSQDANFSSTSNNQFLVRASGGVGIGTNNPQAQLHVRGTVIADAFVGDGSGLSNVTITDGQLPAMLARLNTNQVFTGSNTFAGVMVATNGANQFRGQFNGIVSGNGAGLTNLNIGSLAGVAYVGSNQTFTASNIFAGVVTATNVANQLRGSFTGTLAGNGIAVTNLDASNLVTGTVPDLRLAANVSRLGSSIDSSEITDGSILNADINAAAGIVDTKLATIATAGKVANSATTATANNTPNTIVARDASGNFAAGNITATFTGNGVNLTNLNASQLMTGIVPDARLSNNIPRLNLPNTFTAAQVITNGGQVPLHILGSDAAGTWINLANSSINGRTWNFISSGISNSEGAGKLLIRDAAQGVLMTLSTNGNVGIGTVSPATKLEVIGTVKATDFIGNLNPTGLAAGTVPNALVLTNPGNVFVGNGTGLTNVNAGTVGGLDSSAFWKLGGNNITSPTTQFLGSTNNQAVEFRANNSRALRLESTGASPNLIGGYGGNLVGSNAVGAVIGGGGRSESTNRIFANYGTVGGGRGNTVTGIEATIGGGYGNVANSTAAVVSGGWLNSAMGAASTIGGGYLNTALGTGSTVSGGQFHSTSNNFATVGGGATNYALGSFSAVAGGTINFASGNYATIGGGFANYAPNQSATIGGGNQNTAEGSSSTVGGGFNNQATNDYAAVLGGSYNTAGGDYSVVGGGLANLATNETATVPGGYLNLAGGIGSFAVGVNAKAIHNSTFVWSDYGVPFTSSNPNQFLIRAGGGVAINTNDPAGASLRVNGGIRARGGSPGGFGGNNNGYAFAGNGGDADSGMFSSADGQIEFFSNDQERMRIDPDGKVGIGRVATANRLEVEGDASKSVAGSWLANSDARIKRDVQPVAGALDRLARVQLVSFRYTEDYRAQHPAVEDRRYLNVLAQQFRDVFPEHVKASGERLADGSEILQVDTYPLTIYSAAAVQELNQKLDQKETEITELKQRLEKLEQLLAHKLNGGAK